MDKIKDRYPDEWNGSAPVCDRRTKRQNGKIYFFTKAKIDNRYPDEWNGTIPVEHAEKTVIQAKKTKRRSLMIDSEMLTTTSECNP